MIITILTNTRINMEHAHEHAPIITQLSQWSLMHVSLVSIGFAMMAGLLGCFVVWRRMAYFGDSLAHSSLLGIALGMTYGMSDQPAIMLTGTAFAGLLLWLRQKQHLAMDTLLGILSHAGLALGMLALFVGGGEELDIHEILFGEILNVQAKDVWWIMGTALVVIVVITRLWGVLVLSAIHEDLARAEGVRAVYVQFLFMVLMALVVAVSVHMVGVLLITSMLIIPAAAARLVARSPEAMAMGAVVIAATAMLGGIGLALHFSLPSGPTIVTVALAVFMALLVFNAARRSHPQS